MYNYIRVLNEPNLGSTVEQFLDQQVPLLFSLYLSLVNDKYQQVPRKPTEPEVQTEQRQASNVQSTQ